jgi:hypothetical protein
VIQGLKGSKMSKHISHVRIRPQSPVQILCFWSLSIVLSLSKSRSFHFSKHNVSDTGFCLRLQVKPTQLGLIDRASPYLRTPVPAPRWGIQAKRSINHLREVRKY